MTYDPSLEETAQTDAANTLVKFLDSRFAIRDAKLRAAMYRVGSPGRYHWLRVASILRGNA